MADNDHQESKQEADETAAGTAPSGEQTAEQQKPVEGGSVQTADGEIDYKALLEEERARRQRAEDKIVKMKKVPAKASAEDAGEEGTDGAEDRVARLVEERVSMLADKVRAEIVGSEVEDALSRISGNADERELIREIYENRLVRTGFTRSAIESDLANAKILANRDLILRSNRELAAAIASKGARETSPATQSGSRPAADASRRDMSEADRKILARLEAVKKK